jgi:thiamine pyrophosphate-dependent acetolactate synthase large subunit-like protein
MINAAERRSSISAAASCIRARGQAVALAEKASLPTVMTLMALGAMPVDHPLSLGMLGMHGARCTNLALDECDLLIAVGARFDDRATGKVARSARRRRSSTSTSIRPNSTRSRPRMSASRRRAGRAGNCCRGEASSCANLAGRSAEDGSIRCACRASTIRARLTA